MRAAGPQLALTIEADSIARLDCPQSRPQNGQENTKRNCQLSHRQGMGSCRETRRVVLQAHLGANGDDDAWGRLEGGSVRRLGKLLVVERGHLPIAYRVSTDSPVVHATHKRTVEFQPTAFQRCDSSTNRPELATWRHINLPFVNQGRLIQLEESNSGSGAQ
jgi:hypothetical protein